MKTPPSPSPITLYLFLRQGCASFDQPLPEPEGLNTFQELLDTFGTGAPAGAARRLGGTNMKQTEVDLYNHDYVVDFMRTLTADQKKVFVKTLVTFASAGRDQAIRDQKKRGGKRRKRA